MGHYFGTPLWVLLILHAHVKFGNFQVKEFHHTDTWINCCKSSCKPLIGLFKNLLFQSNSIFNLVGSNFDRQFIRLVGIS